MTKEPMTSQSRQTQTPPPPSTEPTLLFTPVLFSPSLKCYEQDTVVFSEKSPNTLRIMNQLLGTLVGDGE